MTGGARNVLALAVGALMAGLLVALALSGRSPGLPEMRFEPHGIIPGPSSAVAAAEIRTGREQIAFRRTQMNGWSFGRSNAPAVPPELASHLEMALHFMHVSRPTRSLDPREYEGTSFADFGLDPPVYLVSFGHPDGSAIVVDFGTLNPSGTSQYVRLIGQPTLYLMPRHVGTEWELTADIARRILPPDAGGNDGSKRRAGLLLTASVDRLWAIEIVFGGKLHRFERDRAGSWLLHIGQHTHTGDSDAHIADPTQARIIAAALAGLDHTQIEAVVSHRPSNADLDRYGLSRPALIILMYARDNSSPLARLAIGNITGDSFSRYAQLSDGDVLTIAAYKATGMVDLLKAVGAAS